MATKKTATKSKTQKATTKKTSKTVVVSKDVAPGQKDKFNRLRRWNLIIAGLLAIQAFAVIIIGKATTLPVVTHYLTNDSLASDAAGHTVLAPAVRHLFFIDIRYLVMGFLLIAAIIYWLIATIRRRSYEADLQNHVNKLRWVNFGLSSGIMFILIAMLNGVYDSATLMTVFVLVALLHFLAYFGEAKALNLRAKMELFIAICVAGGAVWLIIASYLKGALFYGQGLSHAVYWIDGTIFALTLGLAYNKLQVFRAQGKWADYLYGERVFMGLNFAAATLLTWLVFAGFLK